MHSWRRVLLVFESHQLYPFPDPFIAHLGLIVLDTGTVTVRPPDFPPHPAISVVLWVIAQ